MNGKREYGDYQTPLDFAEKVCLYLKDVRHITPSTIIEPTCGIGNFLKSSLVFNANEYYGIEINPDYCDLCKKNINNEKTKIINADFFTFSTKKLIKDNQNVLIIGNPPWVTNSTLSTLNSINVPIKKNIKNLKGIDAITGSSNFDICEYMLLQILFEYQHTNATVAMLCKTSVARNIFFEANRLSIPFNSFDILEFDAKKIFGINASACLVVIQLSSTHISKANTCNVYDFASPQTLKRKIVYSNGKIQSNLSKEYDFDGYCCFEWRQGIKHDCSQIMELTIQNGILKNKRQETVHIENDIVFPLIKSSMFKSPVIHSFSNYVIVTQRKTREDTKHLEYDAPKTWKYLNNNIALFNNRKSSIYKGAPLFSMFGVGDYSYSKYKVGISGFYKQPMFSVIYSDDNKPVMIDDTSYFICFDSFDMAYVAMLLLNSDKVKDFLINITFMDSKRPYTKRVLERIDFNKIVCSLNVEDLTKTEDTLKLSNYLSLEMYDLFKGMIHNCQMSFI